MVIWKYELEEAERQVVKMPAGADLLSVAYQGDELCLWAMVDQDSPSLVGRDIEIIGTGNPMPDGKRVFIGTGFIGPFVWHVFERFA